MAITVTNQTGQDYWFGPLHLAAGVGSTLSVDDTSDTSLYRNSDAVADALNNVFNAGKVTVSGAAAPFPRPTGVPEILHGDGSPDGSVFAGQGSLFMRRDNTGAANGLYAAREPGNTLSNWAATTIPAGTIVRAGVAAPGRRPGSPLRGGAVLIELANPADTRHLVFGRAYRLVGEPDSSPGSPFGDGKDPMLPGRIGPGQELFPGGWIGRGR